MKLQAYIRLKKKGNTKILIKFFIVYEICYDMYKDMTQMND